MCLGVHNAGHLKQMGVSANRPKMDQFGIFSTMSYKKSKLKEGIIYGKIDISCILGPMVRAVLVKCMPSYQPNMGRYIFLTI